MSFLSPKKLLFVILAALLGWLSLRYLLPILLPFVLAAVLALAAEPLVVALQKRTKLPRVAASGVGVTLSLGILVLLVMVLGAFLVRQLQRLMAVVPDLEGTALHGMESLQGWLLDLAKRAPDSMEPMLQRSVKNFFSDGTVMLDKVTGWLLGLASGVVSHLPDSALGIGTWLLACYMFSAKLPRLREWIRGHLPQSWHDTWLPTLRQMKKSITGWLMAQLKLISVTFFVLTVGFWMLRVSHGFIWAFVISLVDALPVLGTGVVLVPWSIVCFVQGDTVRAVGLLGIYAAAWLVRSILEPRLVGKQLGLDSLVTLLAMYTGYRLWGILGMILAPLLAVTVVQLFTVPKEG